MKLNQSRNLWDQSGEVVTDAGLRSERTRGQFRHPSQTSGLCHHEDPQPGVWPSASVPAHPRPACETGQAACSRRGLL